LSDAPFGDEAQQNVFGILIKLSQKTKGSGSFNPESSTLSPVSQTKGSGSFNLEALMNPTPLDPFALNCP
jgi:hypothetical protein